MSILDELEKKSIVILGMGKEGISSYSFLRKHFPSKHLGLADKRSWSELDCSVRELAVSDTQARPFLGNEYLESIAHYDIILKSPGISPFLPELAAAEKSGKMISSNTEIFLENCRGIIIGITGTKGKSTTSALIYEVLKNGGYDVRLAGNFGTPPLSTLDGADSKTIFVTEMSSYQLMNLNKSPHIAVLQDIVREHLDYHQTFEAYVRAKQKITQYQLENDCLIYNSSYPIPSDMAKNSRAKKIPFGFKRTESTGCFLENDILVYHSDGKDEPIISAGEVPIKGKFNLQNVMPSILLGKLFEISNKNIADAVHDYKPLEHRLEFAGMCDGISFYNDSLATIPEATIAAISAFSTKQIILIAGGFDRGQDFCSLAKTITANNVKAVILFPATGKRLWNEIVLQANEKDDLPEHVFVTNMRDGVMRAYNFAKKDDIVLMSPAGASFECFKDYIDRGSRFKAEVKRLEDEFDTYPKGNK